LLHYHFSPFSLPYRYNEFERASNIFKRFVSIHPEHKNWLKWSKFEESHGHIGILYMLLFFQFSYFLYYISISKQYFKFLNSFVFNYIIKDLARQIYEECLTTLGELADQHVYISFAKFETRMKEIDRARVIYKYALDHLPKGQTDNLYKEYAAFEKQYGDREGIESVVEAKRRAKYEEVIFYHFRKSISFFIKFFFDII